MQVVAQILWIDWMHKGFSRSIASTLFLLLASLPSVSKAQETAANRYKSQYVVVGTMLRAMAVCEQGKKQMAEAMGHVIGGPELRVISKSFPKLTEKWMREGAGSFNDRIMGAGLLPACKFANEEATRLLAGGSAAPADELAIEYTATFKGTCKYKFLNRDSFFPCDEEVTLVNYANHTSEFTFRKDATVFVFFGRKDRQPNLENYYLEVDTAKFAVDGKGVQGAVEGECHMRLNADASKFYEVKCDVFDRKKTGLEFNFYLEDITSFKKS